MMKPFDTDRTPWLFTPHDDGELDVENRKPRKQLADMERKMKQ